ncbi:hypothetical protein CKO28_02930 [Rhodovibrio sodomensis]|uniref:Uncharacterized protein n=1 Tax=Rhodovibrio sodomensis TaxID=1088 RepID=A0ABS1DAQ7_9PROT|nr:hypothetical protein [Rhodovibrio sodomensis]MBK1666997.1 hypothetical protein [Rhodovibrio sodomensis]
MPHEALIDGEPVPRTIEPRRASAWLVRADGALSVTIGSLDLSADVVADLAAHQTNAREVSVQPISAGMFTLDSAPGQSEFMVFNDIRVNERGNYVAVSSDKRDVFDSGADAPTHAGGAIHNSGRPIDGPVSAWRIQWPDGRAWLMIYPTAEIDSETVRSFLISQHDQPFVLGRIDTGTLQIDPASPAPAGYKVLLAETEAAAGVPAMN